MVLSKNEQIAVYVVIVLVIVVAGLFIFLLPEYNKIDDNKAALALKEKELRDLEEELSPAKEEALNSQILEAYRVGKITAESFYEEMTEYEADRELRKILNEVTDPYDGETKLNFDTGSMKITGLTTQPLTLTLFYPSEVMYPIKDKSQVDVSIYDTGGAGGETNAGAIDDLGQLIERLRYMDYESALEFYEEHKNNLRPDLVQAMREFLEGQSETVAVQTISFEILLTREEVGAIEMYLLNLDKSTYIKKVTYDVIEIDEEKDTAGGGAPPSSDGEASPPDRMDDDLKVCTVEMSFLCVQRMDELDESKIKQN